MLTLWSPAILHPTGFCLLIAPAGLAASKPATFTKLTPDCSKTSAGPMHHTHKLFHMSDPLYADCAPDVGKTETIFSKLTNANGRILHADPLLSCRCAALLFPFLQTNAGCAPGYCKTETILSKLTTASGNTRHADPLCSCRSAALLLTLLQTNADCAPGFGRTNISFRKLTDSGNTRHADSLLSCRSAALLLTLLQTNADCAPGFGRTETVFSKLTANGKTRLVKTFSCSQCGPNQVPLTPQAGLRITNAGVVLVQEPIVAAAGEKVPRSKYLPVPAAKRFNLTPGQCVECPAGSIRTAEGISCEGEAVNFLA
jgi:hypothetical protein